MAAGSRQASNRSRSAILSVLVREEGISRGRLAELSGLPLSTVSDVVRRLIAEGVVREELGPRSGRPGRPQAVLRLQAPPGAVAALGVARGGLQAGVIGSDGRVLAVGGRAFDYDADGDFEPAAALLHEALSDAGVVRGAIREVVLTLPAPVHDGRVVPLRRAAGLKATSARLRWLGDDPAAPLRRLMRTPVRVENDANVEALAEATFGAARDAQIAVHVKVVGGLGGGIVVHRRLIRGAVGFAGELAHMHVDDAGPVCVCGGRGCLAGSADLYAIVRLLQPAFDHEMTLDHVIALSEQHDGPTLRLLRDLGRTIGGGLGAACVLLNPDVITVDGGLKAAVNPVIEGVREGLERTAPGPAAASVDVRAGALGGTAQLLGALALSYPAV